jgi:hypothetical protein
MGYTFKRLAGQEEIPANSARSNSANFILKETDGFEKT